MRNVVFTECRRISIRRINNGRCFTNLPRAVHRYPLYVILNGQNLFQRRIWSYRQCAVLPCINFMRNQRTAPVIRFVIVSLVVRIRVEIPGVLCPCRIPAEQIPVVSIPAAFCRVERTTVKGICFRAFPRSMTGTAHAVYGLESVGEL